MESTRRREAVGWGKWSRQLSTRSKMFLAFAIIVSYLYLSGFLFAPFSRSPYSDMNDPTELAISLPPNIEEITLARFDERVRTGDLFYEPSDPEELVHNGFLVRTQVFYSISRHKKWTTMR